MPNPPLNLTQRVNALGLKPEEQKFAETVIPTESRSHLEALNLLQQRVQELKQNNSSSVEAQKQLQKLEADLKLQKQLRLDAGKRAKMLSIISEPEKLQASFPESILKDGQELTRILEALKRQNVKPAKSELDSVDIERVSKKISSIEEEIEEIQESQEGSDLLMLEAEEGIIDSIESQESFKRSILEARSEFGLVAAIFKDQVDNLQATRDNELAACKKDNEARRKSSEHEVKNLREYIAKSQVLIGNYKIATEENPGLLEIDPNEHAKDRKFKEQLKGSYDIAQRVIVKAESRLKELYKVSGSDQLKEIEEKFAAKIKVAESKLKEFASEVQVSMKDRARASQEPYRKFALELEECLDLYQTADVEDNKADKEFVKKAIADLKEASPEAYSTFIRLNPEKKILLERPIVDPEILKLNSAQLLGHFNGRPSKNISLFTTWLNSNSGSSSFQLQWGALAGVLNKMGIDFSKNGDEITVQGTSDGTRTLSKSTLLSSKKVLAQVLRSLDFGGVV